MRRASKWFIPAALLVVASWGNVSYAEDAAQTTPGSGKKQAQTAVQQTAPQQQVDEDWLNTVWTQVDDMVRQEEYKLQETVTVAAVRGAEAQDNILDKLYYRGGKRYPSQDKLKKAIETLKKAIEQDPKAEQVPKQRFFIAQCYEKLGQPDQARVYYQQITKAHPDTPWAEKSRQRLAQLASSD